MTGLLDFDGSVTVYRTEDGTKALCRGLEYHCSIIEIGSPYWESLKFNEKTFMETIAKTLRTFFW